MEEPLEPVTVTMTKAYNETLGMFHNNWAAIDLYTDFAIFKCLDITPQQAHMILSGMMWGKKAKLLADLLKTSANPWAMKILQALGAMQAAKREIITHAYSASDVMHIYFLEKTPYAKEAKAKKHTYTLEEFCVHVSTVAKDAERFRNSLGASQDEINQFVDAAIS